MNDSDKLAIFRRENNKLRSELMELRHSGAPPKPIPKTVDRRVRALIRENRKLKDKMSVQEEQISNLEAHNHAERKKYKGMK